MNRRYAYIENRRTLADSGEITTDVAIKDPITSIMIEFRATNGATDNVDNPLAENVSSIELIDGGNTLFSLTGKQLEALTMFNRGYDPYSLHSELGGNTQNLLGEIQFGRWHGDTVYAFDPSRFSNPQLRIKWNLATNRAVGATGYVTGTGTFTAIADVMEGGPLPQGMVIAKQHYSFTTAASGDETVEIPTDQRIKAILVQSESDTGGGLYGLSNLKLTGDEDKLVVFDMAKTDLQRIQSLKNPPFTYKHQFHTANGTTVYPIIKQEESVSLLVETGDTVLGYVNYGIGNGAVSVYTAGSADSNKRNLTAIVTGWMPYHCAMLDMGEYDDPTTWFDPTAFRRLRLKLTQNAASSTAAVVLVQEYAY